MLDSVKEIFADSSRCVTATVSDIVRVNTLLILQQKATPGSLEVFISKGNKLILRTVTSIGDVICASGLSFR